MELEVPDFPIIDCYHSLSANPVEKKIKKLNKIDKMQQKYNLQLSQWNLDSYKMVSAFSINFCVLGITKYLFVGYIGITYKGKEANSLFIDSVEF